MVMKPNYMLIGASKCGTSTVCGYLSRHPDVFMVECKEPQCSFPATIYINVELNGMNLYTMMSQTKKCVVKVVIFIQ